MKPRDSLFSAGWMALALAGAVTAAVVVDRIGLQPAFLLTPLAAALVVGLLFWFKAPEGIGAFLLVSLLALTLQHWLAVDLRLFDETTVTTFLAIGVVRHGLPNGRIQIGIKELALLVFVIASLTSSLVGAVSLTTSGPAFILVMKAIAFFYIVSWLQLTVADVCRIGLVILATGLVIAALGFVELANPTAFQNALRLPSFASTRGNLTVVKSIFLHPGLLAWMTVFASLILYARFIVTRDWWLVPAAIVLNVLTIFTGRRTSLIGILVALLFAVAWHWRHPTHARWALGVWAPVLAGLAIIGALFLSSFATLYGESLSEYTAPPQLIADVLGPHPDPEEIATMPPRIALYVASLAIARDHFPLGAGLGMFGSEMSRVAYSPLYARYGLTMIPGLAPGDAGSITDTFWPMVLGEAGVVGLLGFAIFIASILVELWRVARMPGSAAFMFVTLAALLVFVESIVASSTSQPYAAPPIAYFVFGTAAAALAVRASLPALAARADEAGGATVLC